jgi:hypothetical protein
MTAKAIIPNPLSRFLTLKDRIGMTSQPLGADPVQIRTYSSPSTVAGTTRQNSTTILCISMHRSSLRSIALCCCQA